MRRTVNKIFITIYGALLLFLFVSPLFAPKSADGNEGLFSIEILVKYFYLLPALLVLHLIILSVTKPGLKQPSDPASNKTSAVGVFAAIILAFIIFFVGLVLFLAVNFHI